ncbi:MAG: hypothetical protein LBK02_05735 [Treponema sp.]|jgi:hypothetical protein|nr:hypothetical protein [Treponema sp.]
MKRFAREPPIKRKQTAPPVIAALLAAVFLAACGGIGGNSPGGAHIGVYRGSRPPKVGESLHAISTGGFSGDFIWEWAMKRDDSRWYEITVFSDEYPYNYGTLSGNNDSEFTIGEGLVDFYLRVKRKTKDADNTQSLWVYSDILGRIQPAPAGYSTE